VFGKSPHLSSLESRKQLLVAESELNRAQVIADWQTMTDGVRTLGSRMKSVTSLASAAALFVSGVSAFRRSEEASNGKKPSWLQTAFKGAQVASSIWLAFRSQGRD
jgi:hypothetical protein